MVCGACLLCTQVGEKRGDFRASAGLINMFIMFLGQEESVVTHLVFVCVEKHCTMGGRSIHGSNL